MSTVAGSPEDPEPLPLTARESEIMKLVAQGLSNNEIADRLTVSVRTVEGHIYRVVAKRSSLQSVAADARLRLRRYGPEMTGHEGPVIWAVWGRVEDRPVLATGGEDGTVRLWDPVTGAAQATLTGHEGPVIWGAWGRVEDRPVLATGADDGTVQLWETGR